MNEEQQATIKKELYEWSKLPSSVPQGSVFGAVPFNVYFHELGITISFTKFACDRKLEGIASTKEDQIITLELDDLLACSDRNLIMWTAKSCSWDSSAGRNREGKRSECSDGLSVCQSCQYDTAVETDNVMLRWLGWDFQQRRKCWDFQTRCWQDFLWNIYTIPVNSVEKD